jgi:uncharacterized protein YggT (Ycf19 family)
MGNNVPDPQERRYDQEVVVRDKWQRVMTPSGPVVQGVAVTERHDRAAARQGKALWITGLISFLCGTLVVLIALRVLLKLLVANPGNGFVRFLYNVTEPFVAPFLTILPAVSFREGQVLEFSALIAIVVYLILGWFLDRLLWLLIVRPTSGRTATRIERRGR